MTTEAEAWIAQAIAVQDDMVKRPAFTGMLIKRARDLAKAAMKELATIDPTDAKRIAWLQGEVVRYRELKTWILEVQKNAKAAWAEMDEADRRELAESFAEETYEE